MQKSKADLWPMVYVLGFVLILLVLGVDGLLTLKLGHYDARLSYLGAAIIGLASLLDPRFGIKKLWKFLEQKPLRLWMGMVLPALIATVFVSANPKRSTAFTIWSIGTLVGVPWIAYVGWTRIPKLFSHAVAAVVGFYGIIAGLDFLSCVRGGTFFIARVYQNEGVCRPHGWYQEPNYLGGFLLLAFAVFRTLDQGTKNRVDQIFFRWAWILAAVGALATTSRLTLVALPLIFIVQQAASLRISRKVLLRAGVSVLGFALLVSGLAFTYKDSSFVRMTTLGYRFEDARAGFLVFMKSPVWGVGPGSAGAYLVQKMPDDRFLKGDRIRKPEDLEYLKNDPLSTNLYTELLSEWGLLGSVLFFLGLGYWIHWGNSFSSAVPTLTSLIFIYGTSQTLPRFDLIFLLAFFGIGIRNKATHELT
ncbi:MAG: O-antigen ligase family protein [Bdellovibrionales bacterium]|nr:O-antigen ligase family protein [Bdellovibrionales bacterium]